MRAACSHAPKSPAASNAALPTVRQASRSMAMDPPTGATEVSCVRPDARLHITRSAQGKARLRRSRRRILSRTTGGTLLFRILIRLFSGRRRPTGGRKDTSVIVVRPAPPPPVETVLRGRCWVVDGDTIVINKVFIRLAGIDAPELDHPWGIKSKWALVQLCKGQIVTARLKPDLSYDRVVAECYLPDGRDLAAEMVRSGLALDWPKFSGGKYRHLEPADARRKLWRADARQRGRWPPQ